MSSKTDEADRYFITTFNGRIAVKKGLNRTLIDFYRSNMPPPPLGAPAEKDEAVSRQEQRMFKGRR